MPGKETRHATSPMGPSELRASRMGSEEASRAPDGLAVAWVLLSSFALALVFASSLIWIDHNPGPVDWDNAEYVNMVVLDHYAYQQHGLRGVLMSLLTVDAARPPGYRIVVLPMTVLGGVSIVILRLTSVVLMGLMAVLVYLAVRRPAGPVAGMLASALVCSLVAVNQSMRIYRTETALYPCVVGLLFFLIIGLYTSRVRWPLWVGLGVTLGLGALSKVTFASIAGPVVLAALAFAWLGILGPWRLWHVLAACAIGGLLAGPLYARNSTAILSSAREAAFFVRHGYDAWTWLRVREWVWMVADWGVGRGVSLLVIVLAAAAVGVAAVRLARGQRPALASGAALSLYLCLAAGVPIIASQLLLTNTFTTRHVSPGYIALAMAVSIAAGAAGALKSRTMWLVAAWLFYEQLSFWTPEALHSRRDVWDWEHLYQAVEQSGDPMYIVHLGNGSSFNPPFIQAPWIRRGKTVRERWLWRYEDGPIEWSKIESEVARANVVLTAPGYVGDVGDKQDRDNAHNDEFAARLRRDHRFQELAPLMLGGNQDRGTIAVFSRTVPPDHSAPSAGWPGRMTPP